SAATSRALDLGDPAAGRVRHRQTAAVLGVCDARGDLVDDLLHLVAGLARQRRVRVPRLDPFVGVDLVAHAALQVARRVEEAGGRDVARRIAAAGAVVVAGDARGDYS